MTDTRMVGLVRRCWLDLQYMANVSYCQPELAEPLVPELLPYSLSVSFRLIMPGHSARIVSLNDMTSALTQHSISYTIAKTQTKQAMLVCEDKFKPHACSKELSVILTAWTELHSRLVSKYRSARFSSSLNLPSACQSNAPNQNSSQILQSMRLQIRAGIKHSTFSHCDRNV